MMQSPVRFSVLDLAPITQGHTAADALRNSADLARHAEAFGYHRFWLAEHHNIPGVASAATSVVIGHVAAATKTIRVGSGGIMLPNHAPLAIAEQFGTLESLFPGRIDLGLGRAPGGDRAVAHALRRNLGSSGDTFPRDVMELQNYFADIPNAAVKAIPGAGLNVPLFLLGSSDFSARFAAEIGLPFAFASHFAPDYLAVALDLYRSNFKPSAQLDRPHALVGVNVFAADTDAEAQHLFTSLQQAFLGILQQARTPLPPPIDRLEGPPVAIAEMNRMTRVSAVGSPGTVKAQLETILDATDADELIFTAQIYDPAARVRSFEIAADVMRQINAERAATPELAPCP